MNGACDIFVTQTALTFTIAGGTVAGAQATR